MGYPVPVNSPQITVAGVKYAVAAFDWPAPFSSSMYKVGVFQFMPDGTWNQVGADAVVYTNLGDCLADIRAKGGTVKYLQWLIAKINVVLSQFFNTAPPPPPVGEPTTEDAARAWLTGAVPALKLTIINGVPTLG